MVEVVEMKKSVSGGGGVGVEKATVAVEVVEVEEVEVEVGVKEGPIEQALPVGALSRGGPALVYHGGALSSRCVHCAVQANDWGQWFIVCGAHPQQCISEFSAFHIFL